MTLAFLRILKHVLLALGLIANFVLGSCQTLVKETANTQMPSKTYVISPKREHASDVARDWQDNLTKIEGIEVIGGNARRVKVKATLESIKTAKDELGQGFYIEPTIEHQPSFK